MALEQGLSGAGAQAGHGGGVRALEHVGDAGEATLLRAGHGGGVRALEHMGDAGEVALLRVGHDGVGHGGGAAQAAAECEQLRRWRTVWSWWRHRGWARRW